MTTNRFDFIETEMPNIQPRRSGAGYPTSNAQTFELMVERWVLSSLPR
jgi:hypothetical protein